MIKIDSLKAGDVLYDVHSERAGNTTMRREGCWECYVRAVDSDGQWVEISRNGNPARRFAAVPRGYKRAPKEWILSELFSARRCHFCMMSKPDGHAPDCEHPRAIAARKKAAVGQKEPK
jgi:hypothetical protein